jgi:hypothetical protein
MHPILVTLHSYNRYLILAALVFVLVRSVSGWLGNKSYDKADNIGASALLGLSHLQLVLGLVMYAATSAYTQAAFANFGAAMKDSTLRYFAVEHITAMIIAVALIQIGRIASKKAVDGGTKHKKMAVYTGIATLIIVGTLAQKGLLLGSVGQ